ncbi:MAG: response regulator [Anaerolineales bacterium]|nr:response regulator [Anaerolineales bacterium]MCL4261004.1 response regulator [Anaerolineales bacterium]
MREIWIVDDNQEMCRAIELMLKVLDFRATIFNSAPAAVEIIASGKLPDLIILDVNMPEVSGLDMVEFLRRKSESKNLPIVMLSYETDDGVVDKALRIGADAYIRKPATLEELEKAIATAFYKRLPL